MLCDLGVINLLSQRRDSVSTDTSASSVYQQYGSQLMPAFPPHESYSEVSSPFTPCKSSLLSCASGTINRRFAIFLHLQLSPVVVSTSHHPQSTKLRRPPMVPANPLGTTLQHLNHPLYMQEICLPRHQSTFHQPNQSIHVTLQLTTLASCHHPAQSAASRKNPRTLSMVLSCKRKREKSSSKDSRVTHVRTP